MEKIRVRIAPSPTGMWHIGNLRTALFNFLYARQNGGTFIMRVEDTDQARLVPGAVENVLEILERMQIQIDEGPTSNNGVISEKGEYGPYVQSQRLDMYKKYAEELIANKHAYYCFCTQERLQALRESQQAQKVAPKYDKLCLNLQAEEVSTKIANGENHVVRLNVPTGKTIKFNDLIHGEIIISSNEVDDQVLLKSDGFPTYHLAVVVDDNAMKISHVIRGEEWIPSTPKHILMYEAFGWEVPTYAHLPLLLSKSKKKLSKREGDVAVSDFFAKGYLPEALRNFIALLGWNPKTEQEIFTLDELITQFSFDKVNKAGAVFDPDKLDWINGQYIRQLSLEDLSARVQPYLIQAGIDHAKYPNEFLLKVLKLEQERLKKLSEIGERVNYFFSDPFYDPALLVWKKGSVASAKENLLAVAEFINNLDSSEFTKDNLESRIKNYIQEKNLSTGEVLWPLRVALSGLDASPGPFEIMDTFGALTNGKEIILARIQTAIDKL